MTAPDQQAPASEPQSPDDSRVPADDLSSEPVPTTDATDPPEPADKSDDAPLHAPPPDEDAAQAPPHPVAGAEDTVSDDAPAATGDQPRSEPASDTPPDLTGSAQTEDPIDAAPRPDPSPDKPEPTPALAPVPVEQPRISRGPGFVTLLLGGVIAGGIGYAIAEYDLFTPGAEDPIPRIETRLDDQSGRIDTLGAQTSAAEEAAANAVAAATAASEAAAAAATPEDLEALRGEIAGLSSGADGAADPALAARLSDAEARIEALSTAGGTPPEGGFASADEVAALEQALADLRQTVTDQQAAIDDATASADAARSSAADETRRITVRGALARIEAALENGEPFVDATSDLETAGGVDVPPALDNVADQGVSPLGSLQDDFPPAARAALSVSIREDSGGSAWDRFGAFLRAQTGARSLDAREGDDPDAILSRAQTAVRTGDLATALDEIATLPEGGQAELADWSDRARARLDALAAHDALVGSLNSN